MMTVQWRIAALGAAACGVMLLMQGAATAQSIPHTPEQQAQIDALVAAGDPSSGPPILEPVVKTAKGYERFGPPGGYFPDQAARMAVGGMAVAQCLTGKTGVLKKCKVLAVFPKGWGFDDSILRMAQARYMTVAPDPSRADETVVRVVMKYMPPPPNSLR